MIATLHWINNMQYQFVLAKYDSYARLFTNLLLRWKKACVDCCWAIWSYIHISFIFYVYKSIPICNLTWRHLQVVYSHMFTPNSKDIVGVKLWEEHQLRHKPPHLLPLKINAEKSKSNPEANDSPRTSTCQNSKLKYNISSKDRKLCLPRKTNPALGKHQLAQPLTKTQIRKAQGHRRPQ